MRTEAQIIKAEKLSLPMIQAITRIGPDGRCLGERSVTIVALINRGILTTATPTTSGEHLLTGKGKAIAEEIIADTFSDRRRTRKAVTGPAANDADREAWEADQAANDAAQTAWEQAAWEAEQAACEKASNDAEQAAQWADEQFDAEIPESSADQGEAVRFEVADKVTATGRDDLGAGEVTSVGTGNWGQTVTVQWSNSPMPYPANLDTLVKVEDLPEITITPEPIRYNASKFTARIVDRDESAEFLARHPEPKGEPLVNLGSPLHPVPYESLSDLWKATAEREKLARSIAYEFGHIFVTWGINDTRPEQPIVPRELDRRRMLQFYRDGSIYDPGQLINEVRSEMADRVADVDTTDHFTRLDLVDSLMWLGWLNAYILECGTVGSDGWQDRRRGPQDGWAAMGLYSTEPSDETELPAWADVEDGDSFGCSATISPQGRYNDAETCGDGITRAEYYANGEESGMCEAHRLAEIVANDTPW